MLRYSWCPMMALCHPPGGTHINRIRFLLETFVNPSLESASTQRRRLLARWRSLGARRWLPPLEFHYDVPSRIEKLGTLSTHLWSVLSLFGSRFTAYIIADVPNFHNLELMRIACGLALHGWEASKSPEAEETDEDR